MDNTSRINLEIKEISKSIDKNDISLNDNQINNDNIDTSNNTIHDNKLNKECYEMSQIRYKSTKLKKSNRNTNVTANINRNKIDTILNDNIKNINEKPWNKLSKNEKKILLKQYVETKENSKHLLSFLYNCLEKQKLSKNKDICYDNVERKITDIPNLEYIPKRKMFTLRNKDKKDTTLKNLAKIKKKKR